MIINTPSQQVTTLGQPGQLQAPQETVAQFEALLRNMGQTLQQGTTSFGPSTIESRTTGGLLEETAVRVNKAEVGMKEIQREMDKSTQALSKPASLDGNVMKDIVYQKSTAAMYSINLARLESGASNFSEELESVTRRR